MYSTMEEAKVVSSSIGFADGNSLETISSNLNTGISKLESLNTSNCPIKFRVKFNSYITNMKEIQQEVDSNIQMKSDIPTTYMLILPLVQEGDRIYKDMLLIL